MKVSISKSIPLPQVPEPLKIRHDLEAQTSAPNVDEEFVGFGEDDNTLSESATTISGIGNAVKTVLD